MKNNTKLIANHILTRRIKNNIYFSKGILFFISFLIVLLFPIFSIADINKDVSVSAVVGGSGPSENNNGGSGDGSKILTSVLIPDLKILDIVKDGIINMLDFNIMMVNWSAGLNADGTFNPADMNKDGVVDIFDFNMLMVYWGYTYQL